MGFAAAFEATSFSEAFLSLSGVLRSVPLVSSIEVHGVGVLLSLGREAGRRTGCCDSRGSRGSRGGRGGVRLVGCSGLQA